MNVLENCWVNFQRGLFSISMETPLNYKMCFWGSIVYLNYDHFEMLEDEGII